MLKWNGGGNAPNLEMKKYLITKATVCNGQRVNPGDVVEITVDESLVLSLRYKIRFGILGQD